ncbi:hypothetical protein MRX96_057252 [Rhipicephalus microplus]
MSVVQQYGVVGSVLASFGDEYKGPHSKSLSYQSFTGPAAACFTLPAQKPAAFLRAAYVDEGIAGCRAKTLTRRRRSMPAFSSALPVAVSPFHRVRNDYAAPATASIATTGSVLASFGDEYEGPDSKRLSYQSLTGPAAACFTLPAQKPAAFLRAAYVDEGIAGRRAKTLTRRRRSMPASSSVLPVAVSPFDRVRND